MAMNADRQEIRDVTEKMNKLMYREETMWMQQSRINLLKEGDHNTMLFHNKVVWRARKNKIKGIEDKYGVCHTDAKKMQDMAPKYFENIFTVDPNLQPNQVFDLIKENVTE
jgi:hypothetical protein